MSNTKTFAERELDILTKSSTDPENRPIIEEFIPEILALVDKFGNSGQSGGSSPYVAHALSEAVKHLCMQQPICPMTGIDDEWMDVSEISDEPKNTLYQSKRCYALFKDNSGCWFLDAIVWVDEEGYSWSGTALLPIGNDQVKKIQSRQYIKGFPFEPKTFYIDRVRILVGDDKNNEDHYEDYVKDPSQLEEVFKYYKENE